MEGSVQRVAHTVFVGRQSELTKLRAALDGALEARGRLVLLAGEPGIGKTRTASEFAAEARRAGACVLWGSCYDGEWAPPFGPFAEAITAYARQREPEILRDELGFGAAPIARVVPAVRERLPDVPEPAPLQPDEEHFRVLDAVSQFLIAVAAHVPVVLVLDDLHWVDKGTIAMLRHVARFAPHHRVLLLGTYRDVELDAQHPLTDALGALYRETTCERILLQGLEATEVAQLIARSDVPTRVHDTLARAIGAATNGNPFFVGEVLRQFIEDDQLARVSADPSSILKIKVPDSVRQVISRRLRRLSAETNRLVLVAAGFSGPFHLGVAARVAGLEEAAALNAIDDALRAQLVHPADTPERYDFAHALIRETMYSGLNPSRQTRLHRQIAEVMEHCYGDRVAEHAAEIAQQYSRSKDLPDADRGAAHAIAAADRAEAVAAWEDMATFVRMALEMMGPEDARRPRLLARLGKSLALIPEPDTVLGVVREAVDRLDRNEGPDAATDYVVTMMDLVNDAGLPEKAWALAQLGLERVGATRDVRWAQFIALATVRGIGESQHSRLEVDTAERWEAGRLLDSCPPFERPGYVYAYIPYADRSDALRRCARVYLTGEYRAVVPSLTPVAERWEREGRIARAVETWSTITRCHIALGEFAQARARRDHAVGLASRLPSASYSTVPLVAAEDEWRMAMDDAWEEPLPSVGARTGDTMVHVLSGTIDTAIARIHARRGRVEPALRRLAKALPLIERMPGWSESYVRITCDAAEALWLIGRADHVETIERNLREKVVTPDFRHPMADGRLALARLCAVRGRYNEALDWFAKARVVLDEQGARPLRAIVDYDEALMYTRRGAAGDAERAAPLLETALAQFRTLGMPGWIRRAEHLLREGTEWVRAPQAGAAAPPAQPPPDPLLRKEGERQPATRNHAPEPALTPDTRHLTPDCVFRREGHFWTVAYAGQVMRLRDSKGVQYIAQLLRHPAREVLAFDMISTASGEAQPSSATEVAPRSSDDLGPLLDAQAKREYRERVRDLRVELDEATGNNDLGRAAALRAEIELIGEQLRKAVGLGGKDRTAGAVSERARLTVTKRIKAVLKELDTLHPPLAHHLRACVKTGRICTYVPPPGQAMVWQL